MARKIQRLSQRDDVVILKNAVNEQISALRTGENSLRTSLGIADDVMLGFAGELREKKGQMFPLNPLTTVHSQRPAS